MFDIYGDFEVDGVRYDAVQCDDQDSFQEYWEEVLYAAEIISVDHEAKIVRVVLKYEDNGYLECYGDYALISFDFIKKSHWEELKEDYILFYDENIKKLKLKSYPKLTDEQKQEIKRKTEEFNKMFDFVMGKDEKEG